MIESSPSGTSSDRLTIGVRNDGFVVTLELVGEIDLETAPELDRQLDNIDQATLGHLLIDLSGVSFMDSTGLRSIIRAQKAAESNGRTLAVRRGSRQVQRLFEVAGVDREITMED